MIPDESSLERAMASSTLTYTERESEQHDQRYWPSMPIPGMLLLLLLLFPLHQHQALDLDDDEEEDG